MSEGSTLMKDFFKKKAFGKFDFVRRKKKAEICAFKFYSKRTNNSKNIFNYS